MTKRSMTFVMTSLATLLTAFFPLPVARAEIFEWEYINPANPALGKQQSTTLTPDGAGQYAGPYTSLDGDLTMAYLIGADLTGAYGSYRVNLTDADLSQANLTASDFYAAVLHGANLSQATLTNAYLVYAELFGAN